jgi:glucan phosphorylase
MGLAGEYAAALKEHGYSLEDMVETEQDAGLGNGGLGRLASCFLDSIATLNLPGWGYGLRYKYGLFKQSIGADGGQLEAADDWLESGNPWELRRNDVAYTVRFGGSVETGSDGKKSWVGGQTVKVRRAGWPGRELRACLTRPDAAGCCVRHAHPGLPHRQHHLAAPVERGGERRPV